MDYVRIPASDRRYPAAAHRDLGERAPSVITACGNLQILECKKLALFCSARCPGNIILQTYDAIRHLRDASVTVIGGFHSPMEKECLALLLRGSQPVVVCLARGLDGMRLPSEWTAPLEAGRLLVLSTFEGERRRVTADLAAIRNEFVAALADEVLVTHAAPGSKTENLCRDNTDVHIAATPSVGTQRSDAAGASGSHFAQRVRVLLRAPALFFYNPPTFVHMLSRWMRRVVGGFGWRTLYGWLQHRRFRRVRARPWK